MHNHDGKQNNWMMWVMMICCLAPILFIVLFGTGAASLGAPSWAVIGFVLVLLVGHLAIMKKSGEHSGCCSGDEDCGGKKSDSKSDHKNCH